jgi:hypothetical protein
VAAERQDQGCHDRVANNKWTACNFQYYEAVVGQFDVEDFVVAIAFGEMTARPTTHEAWKPEAASSGSHDPRYATHQTFDGRFWFGGQPPAEEASRRGKELTELPTEGKHQHGHGNNPILIEFVLTGSSIRQLKPLSVLTSWLLR